MGQRLDIFLQPGEYFVGDARHTLRTLLGSCVSVTLWHPRKKIGAMSHFLLPARERIRETPLEGRYGDEALMLMLRDLQRAGVKPPECQAKIFGGANMFTGEARQLSSAIGHRNGMAARKLLQSHRIRIVSEHLFGVGHRQIIFDIGTGDVWSRQVPPGDDTKGLH
ncbi:chemotaxis protein CheD [Herbaspirillum sp. HC18]|nr:chemotaxis protein CheD [Herbaspirillum sp. HC18]